MADDLMIRPGWRPYVILNSAMSLDGKIATSTGESRLSSPKDLRRVHRLRASVDAIMVGLRTLLTDDPKLTVRFYSRRNPWRIILDSEARTPLTPRVVRTALQAPTIIAVTSRAPKRKLNALKQAGVTVLTCGAGALVSLLILFRRLRRMGVKSILLEGGGTANWSALRQGLVDEISVAISPVILGGPVTLVRGEGFTRISSAVGLRLLKVKRNADEIVLRYRVLQ